ncbi:MAG: hypothetical protein JW876_07215 [Candidatus Krumholzibacteriota bacterium]|nr:hypothetical protein [Candidatus Krumholzibacteriota bacterium]
MSADAQVILSLLRDDRIADFDSSLLFRSEIKDDPAAASILVGIMHDGAPGLAARAREMLCLFDRGYAQALAEGFSKSGASWRGNLLDLLWTVHTAQGEEKQAAAARELRDPLILLLADRDVIPLQTDKPIEVEYEVRVRDEAYLLLRLMDDPAYDEDGFLSSSFDERDDEIRRYGRGGGPMV